MSVADTKQISSLEIEEARAAATAARRRLVEVLEAKLGLDPDAFVARLGATLRIEVMRMEELRGAAPAFDVLPFSEGAQRGCALVRGEADALWLVTDDPFSGEQQAWAEERIAQEFSWRLVHRGDLVAFLASHEETLRALDAVRAGAIVVSEETRGIEDLSLKAISEESSEVVRLVRSTLRDSLMIGASDIHMETIAAGLVIKFRIDGILSQIKFIQDTKQAEQAISRVKVLAELDITERRVPQDGRFKALDRGRAVDFRVSIMPNIYGEDAVLRVLDKQSLYESTQQQLSLDSLGFETGDIRALRRLSHEPYGMLLVTGPTGSGKTTTLYAAITEINNGQDKIVTIEDPVEYQLAGVLQIPVNEKKGLTFARGLRSILRHDPDKIMVGEIRDPETANIAVQSALTGHLVFTTVHANNVFDVIGRFMHMNVDLFSFVSALNAILAQRLVRLVCPHCGEDCRPDAALLKESGLTEAQAASFRFRAGRGCRECRGSGYKGRKAIAELMILNDELRELITARAPVRQLKEAARTSGTRFLRDAALEAVKNGESTLEEINRVTFI
ncbi:MAG: type II/IV secretion system protein [Betaproteobacteria bacterium]|nr:MAG: type II/IV secretion system protein [Betaproteobacteria bacterium]